MRWAQRLKDALDGGQFLLFQQNLVPLTPRPTSRRRSKCCCGCGARRPHRLGGRFLEAAERYQMMPNIDRLVVQGVIEHLKNDRKPRRYFVNLSGQSIGDDGFHAFLLEAIAQVPEFAKYITFEVTETAVISTLSKARKIMQLLAQRAAPSRWTISAPACRRSSTSRSSRSSTSRSPGRSCGT